jgi:REP element-mobilizing transposase RayT
MPRRAIALTPGNYHHIYNRGLAGRAIFPERENYEFFLRRVRDYLTPDAAVLLAFCLMPNHYHLLVEVVSWQLPIAMQELGMSYASAINKRYKRHGRLFQGRFQAKLVAKDAYLLHLSRYNHLNPVAAGLVGKVDEWPYSSFQDFVNPGARSLVEPEIVLDQVGPSKAGRAERIAAYRRFVEGPFGDAAFLGTLLFQE